MSVELYPGRWPAVVKSYDQGSRMCRVEIPGVTDGADVLPLAEIEYPIGDKSRTGQFQTEIEILPGDPIWVAFIGGDPRYPIITGYRNPQAGNSIDWRRWHHKNMELLADMLMKLIAGKDILIQSETAKITVIAANDIYMESGTKVTVHAPLIINDAPLTKCTGHLQVAGQFSAFGAGAAAGAPAATITGDVKLVNGSVYIPDGDMIASLISFLGHKHKEKAVAGALTDPPQS